MFVIRTLLEIIGAVGFWSWGYIMGMKKEESNNYWREDQIVRRATDRIWEAKQHLPPEQPTKEGDK